MKKALIHGTRICELRNDTFPVAPELIWVDVPDDTTDRDTYENSAVVKEVPATLIPVVVAPSLTDMILADPKELAKLKQALGIA